MKQELFPEIADSGLRIDKYLSTVNEQLSRSYIQKLLKSGLVLVDGKPVKASYQVEEGEVISLDIPEAVEPEIEPEDMDLDILYEDMDPSGLRNGWNQGQNQIPFPRFWQNRGDTHLHGFVILIRSLYLNGSVQRIRPVFCVNFLYKKECLT